MRKIAVLSQNTIDKIAAGEVVERPASVVKELVENAIDAGATAITVEIKEGGISFIRVTDNGGGIPKEQVPLAFLRHATSKITQAEDLLQITSLGFRGEALSSISAVSQMEVITKAPEDFMGVRYVIEGGQEKVLEDVGAPNGTTMLVRNLFFNTPARKKFLKTAMTEAGYVSSYMEQLALSHHNISFKYMVNGQLRLHTSGNANLKDVIYGIYGRDITRELIPVQYEKTGISITGFIGKPSIARGNRNFENYYINGRYVKSKLLMKAIEEAYKPYMMQHKYPFVCLQYDIHGEDVDVNVHPTKMEVRFQNQSAVYNATYDLITEALAGKEIIPEVSLTSKPTVAPKQTQPKEKKILVPEPFEKNRIAEEKAVYAPVGLRPASAEPKTENKTTPISISEPVKPKESEMQAKPKEQKQESFPQEKSEVVKIEQMELFDNRLLSKEARVHHRIIGQLFDTYWLVEYDNKFYIIDQHAAHEKVLYERFLKEFAQKEIISQMVSPPSLVSLNLQESNLLKANLEILREFGFEISEFGGKEYSIHAVPANIYGVSVQELFIQILDSLDQEHISKTPDILVERIATAACKAAVKGNNRLSVKEADALIDELLSLENPYNCPHGRPTIISMTKYELEKKFKRIV